MRFIFYPSIFVHRTRIVCLFGVVPVMGHVLYRQLNFLLFASITV